MYYLGVDVGGTNIVGGIVDDNNQIIATSDTPTKADRSAEEIIKDIVKVAKETLAKANLSEKDIPYLGLGVPSTINQQNNHLVFANNLGWKDFDLISEIHKYWDIEVVLANDADCAALGEYYAGLGKNYNSVLFITLGTGVGGGFVLDNKLYTGGDGYGFEPGHASIIADGTRCTCGKKGCLEAYASVTALNRQAREAMQNDKDSLMWEKCKGDDKNINGKIIFDSAKEGDKTANEVVDKYIHYLAIGIGNFITILRPEAVIIGGGVADAGERLFAPLIKELPEVVFSSDIIGVPPILHATLGNDAGIIGAALLNK